MNTEIISSIAVAIIGVAIVAVIFSKQSATAQVVEGAGNAFGGILKIAVSPITSGGGSGGGAVQNTAAPGGFGPFTPSTVTSLFNAAGGISGNLPMPGINN